jgi:phospholipid/cholesterol/gamma-HCH transport system substrate-binding protein
MSAVNRALRFATVCGCVVTTTIGCAFSGVNSLPLPGTVGRGPDAVNYFVEIANVGTLEANAPVMVNDVVVGSVDSMHFSNWHGDITVSVRPDVAIPANAVATIGQTSLLGSMHLALDPPLGQQPSGRLAPDSTLPLNAASTYPSTEQTLSSLSAVVNAGGLGQIGDVIHNLNAALSGRAPDIRRLLTRFNDIVGVLDAQRDSIDTTIDALGRLSGSLAGQTDVIDRLLKEIRPALAVLINERPHLVTALDKLRGLSDVVTQLVHDTEDNLVTNLENLEPTLRALADVGKQIDTAIGYATTFPFTQNIIDRGLHGDYMNEWAIVDLTYARLKRTLFLGTRWGDPDAVLVPAPGDPYYQRYTYDPVGPPPPAGTPGQPEAVPPAAPPPPDAGAPPFTVAGPILPVSPAHIAGSEAISPTPAAPGQIFAGPYGAAPAGGG